MEQRTLELELVSAKDLKDVNLISKMDVYAVVSLDGDAYNGKQKTKTKLVPNCGTNPTFNFPMRFTLDDSLTQQNRLSLEVKLVCERSLGDKDIGSVQVPVKELFDSADPKNMKFISYQVRRPSNRPKGELSFSYKFGEKVAVPAPEVAKKGEPVTAYPVGAPSYGAYAQQATSSSGSGYPPPQPGYGYPPPPPGAGYPEAPPPGYGYPPPQPGYAYPPQQPGYGYPPPGYGYPPVQQQQPEKKKNKFGMGLGAGLLGGVLGGMLIGDMVSDGGGGCGGGGCGGGGCGGPDIKEAWPLATAPSNVNLQGNW
ncbi:hypothetical protein ACLB2K_042082 [Fragaria x ananassa]